MEVLVSFVVLLTLLAVVIHLIGSYLAVRSVKNYYGPILFAFNKWDWVFIVATSWIYLLVHVTQRREFD